MYCPVKCSTTLYMGEAASTRCVNQCSNKGGGYHLSENRRYCNTSRKRIGGGSGSEHAPQRNSHVYNLLHSGVYFDLIII